MTLIDPVPTRPGYRPRLLESAARSYYQAKPGSDQQAEAWTIWAVEDMKHSLVTIQEAIDFARDRFGVPLYAKQIQRLCQDGLIKHARLTPKRTGSRARRWVFSQYDFAMYLLNSLLESPAEDFAPLKITFEEATEKLQQLQAE